jgi:hypothetical protein
MPRHAKKQSAASRHRHLLQYLDRGIDYVGLLLAEGASSGTIEKALRQLRRRIASAGLVFPAPKMSEVRRIVEDITPGCTAHNADTLAKADERLRMKTGEPTTTVEPIKPAVALALAEELGILRDGESAVISFGDATITDADDVIIPPVTGDGIFAILTPDGSMTAGHICDGCPNIPDDCYPDSPTSCSIKPKGI